MTNASNTAPVLSLHTYPVEDFDGSVIVYLTGLSECDETCDPGNCEVTHAEHCGVSA